MIIKEQQRNLALTLASYYRCEAVTHSAPISKTIATPIPYYEKKHLLTAVYVNVTQHT